MQSNTPIQFAKYVGPTTQPLFLRLGIETVGDLLQHYPRYYIDYTAPHTIASAPFDQRCVVKATVFSKRGAVRLSGGRTMVQVSATDNEGSVLNMTWFHTAFIAEKLIAGQEYYFEGYFRGNLARREISHPTVRSQSEVDKQPLVPVYAQTDGLSSGKISRCIAAALESTDPLPETLPAALLTRYKMPGKWQAVQDIHLPASLDAAAAARRRLVFEELFALQLGLVLMRQRAGHKTNAPMKPVSLAPFWGSLPFSPTDAQRRAADEICADMAAPSPMNRLLQGDVGSGKTLVAAAGIYTACQNGYQSVLMAPTEILATQHATTLQATLAPFGVQVCLLTGGMRAAQKRAALAAIASGEATLVVGTHAVLTAGVEFARLGLAVVDEQHRFGVRQRGLLANKAQSPHVLVMSATPIPRTLGLLMYGDLDISILDELPPGRKPIKTRTFTSEKREAMYGFLAREIQEGHQVYIVCPRVEDDDEGATDALQAVKSYHKLASKLLPAHTVGLMHGKLRPTEKAAVMQGFSAGEIDVLVSTTVIEVGVDVPNATIMVIENAERYGLSALHQLRGRVGRGASESWCFLVSDHTGDAAKERLQFLCQTQDGFEIARYDLEHRGPGDFFGDRQHGLPTLQLASLTTDTRVLEAAQTSARQLLAADPKLSAPEHQALATAVERLFRRTVHN